MLPKYYNLNLSQKDVSRFWSKVDIQGPNDCWNWLTGKCKGYGRFSIRGDNDRGVNGLTHFSIFFSCSIVFFPNVMKFTIRQTSILIAQVVNHQLHFFLQGFFNHFPVSVVLQGRQGQTGWPFVFFFIFSFIVIIIVQQLYHWL